MSTKLENADTRERHQMTTYAWQVRMKPNMWHGIPTDSCSAVEFKEWRKEGMSYGCINDWIRRNRTKACQEVYRELEKTNKGKHVPYVWS